MEEESQERNNEGKTAAEKAERKSEEGRVGGDTTTMGEKGEDNNIEKEYHLDSHVFDTVLETTLRVVSAEF